MNINQVNQCEAQLLAMLESDFPMDRRTVFGGLTSAKEAPFHERDPRNELFNRLGDEGLVDLEVREGQASKWVLTPEGHLLLAYLRIHEKE